MKVIFDEIFFDEIDHFHPNFDESVPNPRVSQTCGSSHAEAKRKDGAQAA